MFLKTYDRVSKNGYFDFFGGVSEMGVEASLFADALEDDKFKGMSGGSKNK